MNEVNKQVIFLLFTVGILTLFGGLFVSTASFHVSVVALAAVILVIICFINTEIALYILIITMLLGPQFGAGGEEVVSAARGRAITLRMDDFMLLVIGASWFAKSAIKKELGLFLKTPLNGPIAYYFIACVISTILGIMMNRVNPASGFFFLMKYFEYFIVYFMAVNHLRDRQQIERFVLTLLAVCFIVCIIGMIQIPAGVRVSAPFEGKEGEPNTLGGYLDLMLALVLGLLLTKGLPKFRFFLFLLIPFIAIVLTATLSRSSWLSLVPLILTLLYFSKRKMVIIIPLLIMVIASPLIFPKTVTQRAMYTFAQPMEMGQIQVGKVRIDTSTSARLETWKVILFRDWLKHSFLGYGVTGYTFVDAQYPRILVETGILGLLTFILLITAAYRSALYVYRHTSDPLFSGISLGYLSGFMALLVHGIGANTFIIVRIMEPFWFLTAIVVMIPEIEKHSSSSFSPVKSS